MTKLKTFIVRTQGMAGWKCITRAKTANGAKKRFLEAKFKNQQDDFSWNGDCDEEIYQIEEKATGKTYDY